MIENQEALGSEIIERALLIRETELRFLDLFAQGALSGTVHTCLGQELSALAFAGQLQKNDFVFSSHRCHGHFIAFTGNHEGLIAELLGRDSGVCGGIGSSQHLHEEGFYSNGVQGGIVPVASGMALARKLDRSGAIGVVFIGDGTLGEGVVYESLNIISKWQIPILVVCEFNGWAQSTDARLTLAGDVLTRAQAFGIRTFHSDVWNEAQLFRDARSSIASVRQGVPAFHLVDCYRLGPHSKGDDLRDPLELKESWKRDRLTMMLAEKPTLFGPLRDRARRLVDEAVDAALDRPVLELSSYLDAPVSYGPTQWSPIPAGEQRVVDDLNGFFLRELARNQRALFIGEDVLSPYGGAFKVAKGLSEQFPEQVFTTPLSEAAIVGLGNGLALSGYRPYVELMFGDFVTLAMDQIVNHASKFRHMYNNRVSCPVVIRTPMGGHRGYGPTHSQSLERLVVGIEDVRVFSLNALLPPSIVYESLAADPTDPAIVLEQKVDYAKSLDRPRLENFVYERTQDTYPVLRIRPHNAAADVIIVTYGGMVDPVLDAAEALFQEHEVLAEVVVLIQLHPLQSARLIDLCSAFRAAMICEEGYAFGGMGAEVAAVLAENLPGIRVRRLGQLPVPIPSPRPLEDQVLPNAARVVAETLNLLRVSV